MTLDHSGAVLWCDFVSGALAASRANRSWPDVRALSGHIAAASPVLNGGLGPPLVVDDGTGLLPWDTWARIKADHRVALDEPAHLSPAGSDARAQARRRYHDALRALPVPRIGDTEHALRSNEANGARKLHVVLDKVESNGVIVRLTADVTVAKGMNDARFQELLFPMTSFPVELTLVRLLAGKGVVDVERVTRGAVDLCAVSLASVRPRALEPLFAGHRDGDVCALSFSTCAADVTPGDNDLLPHDTTPLADLAREHLGAREIAHRVYRDRKLVVTAPVAAAARECARTAGTRTVVYELAGGRTA
jgi:hypothetical protein